MDGFLEGVKHITGYDKTDFIIQGSRYLSSEGYSEESQSLSAICEEVYDSNKTLDENMAILRSQY